MQRSSSEYGQEDAPRGVELERPNMIHTIRSELRAGLNKKGISQLKAITEKINTLKRRR